MADTDDEESGAEPETDTVLEMAPTTPLDVGVHEGVSHASYHSDPCVGPSLSRSVASILLDRSPFHARQAHPRFGKGLDADDSAASDRGTIVHQLLLGVGPGFARVEAKDWRTKVAKAARDAARAAGKVPVLADKLDQCTVSVERVRQRFPVFGAGAIKEVTIVWRSGPDGVLCRCRIDVLEIGGEYIIWDVKSCDDATISSSDRAMVDYGRYLQAAVYIEAVESTWPDAQGRTKFVMLFPEVRRPYDVMERELGGEFLAAGRSEWAYAVGQWGWCLKNDKWPGYAEGRRMVSAPEWFEKRTLERQMNRIDWRAGGVSALPEGGSPNVPF